MNIIFQNKGTLSLLDMTTMGDSSKRDDESKIGKFDSGLKYALAILYRNGIKVEIYSGDSKYTFSSKVVKDEVTTKVKELLVINEHRYFAHDILPVETFEHITAFSPQLGYEWKVWMAIREIYSNCLDENGEVNFSENLPDTFGDNTYIVIESNSLLEEIIENWANYFIPFNVKPLYEDSSIKIYENNSQHLKLYKNNILIYEDLHTKARFAYDYVYASIDEMRMLNNQSNFNYAIERCICECNDANFIETFIKDYSTDCYEANLNYSNTLSKTWVDLINVKYANKEIVLFYKELFSNVCKDNRINSPVREVTYNSPTYYWSTAKVDIVQKEEVVEEQSFEDMIKEICKGFEILYPIVESKISKFKSLPDISKKVIYVTQGFTKDDIWEIVKSQFRIESEDNGDYVYKKYAELLTKQKQ